ncbi:MAG TPA: proton-conducting transporter membrane subunit, partial [Devosiaceae bacterium]|nr:proton-conducting transporter membrane subunit [Devosiaceae bacterium]
MPVSPDMLVALLSPAPFVAAALAPALTRALGHRAAWLLALVPLAIFAALATFVAPVAGGAAQHFAVSWVPSLGLDFGITIDGLSLLFALTIAGIGALIIVYSGAYLKGDPAEGRFLATMLLFMGAMLGLVLSDGLVALYVFWEMTAVTSYLLIGHDRTRLAARRAALQALLITVAGGLCLLLAAVLIHAAADTWSLADLPGKAATLAGSGLFMPIVVLLFLAAFTKSAQFPFHFWLPNAMEAPTPVSAYLHSAAMVQAGVYLLARLSPVFSGQPVWTGVLTVIGGLTFLWGAVGGLRQADLKQMLAHSTISSLGLLVLLIGIGGEVGAAGAAAYFLTHALYKAGFFLVAGLIDHETGVRDITALGGLREKMALGFIAAVLAGLSMLGLPPTLGYLAKEAIYAAPGPEPLAELLLPAVLVVGNAILGALALALVAKPFMGPLVPTPKAPQEGPPAMLLGPLLLGMAGIGAALLVPSTAGLLLAPAATAILGHTAELHMGFGLDLCDPAPWLSVATWLLSAVIFWRLALLRAITRRIEGTFPAMFDRLFDAALSGLLAFAAAGT